MGRWSFNPSLFFRSVSSRKVTLTLLHPGLNLMNRKIFPFSGQIFSFQKFPAHFSCCAPIKNFCKNFSVNLPQLAAPKNLHRKKFLFYNKNLRLKIFLAVLDLNICLIGLNPCWMCFILGWNRLCSSFFVHSRLTDWCWNKEEKQSLASFVAHN